MKEKRTGKTSARPRTGCKRLRSLTDRQIRMQGRMTRRSGRARVVMPKAKQTIAIRLDADLLEGLRKQERYQTRINAVLRTYMDANTGGHRASVR